MLLIRAGRSTDSIDGQVWVTQGYHYHHAYHLTHITQVNLASWINLSSWTSFGIGDGVDWPLLLLPQSVAVVAVVGGDGGGRLPPLTAAAE